MSNLIKRVLVLGGSQVGKDPAYIEDARQLGRGLAEAGMVAVHAENGNEGLVGATLEEFKNNGGYPLSVPFLAVAQNMTRKQKVLAHNDRHTQLIKNSDATIILSGINPIDLCTVFSHSNIVEEGVIIQLQPTIILDTKPTGNKHALDIKERIFTSLDGGFKRSFASSVRAELAPAGNIQFYYVAANAREALGKLQELNQMALPEGPLALPEAVNE